MDFEKMMASFSEALERKREFVLKTPDMTNFTFGEVFNPDFMKRHSSFDNITDFLYNGNFGFPDKWPDEINMNKLNKYVKRNTDFKSWDDMAKHARYELLEKGYKEA